MFAIFFYAMQIQFAAISLLDRRSIELMVFLHFACSFSISIPKAFCPSFIVHLSFWLRVQSISFYFVICFIISLIIVLDLLLYLIGISKQAIQFVNNCLATIFAEMSLMGIASSHLEN